jgi:sporulation protein YlmC with PRC-barrel domain
MKKSQEIIGLPVFSIMDEKKIGQVKDLVINPEEGKIVDLMEALQASIKLAEENRPKSEIRNNEIKKKRTRKTKTGS